MNETFAANQLYQRLAEDEWRQANPFSDDMHTAHGVLFHPYAEAADRQEALSLWFQANQPCLFGRVAAAVGSLHYCILTDDDLRQSDQHIANVIRRERRAWKQRSQNPTQAMSSPAHGLILAVASERVALARPDDALLRFSHEIQRLWGCTSTQELHGEVFWETLYLRDPTNGGYVRFTFSVDYFAAAGDRRWWHDHRIPGGIGFTANSVGHMRRYRELYKGLAGQDEWVVKTAMDTIGLAAETAYGKATWLRPLSNGRPVVEDVASPFSDMGNLKPSLTGKDWTRYGGHLHTDHSIRPEFFRTPPEKSKEIKRKEWMQDFQYLYDERSRDHHRFIKGEPVSEEEVKQEAGDPEECVQIVGPGTQRRGDKQQDSGEHMFDDDKRAEVAALLDKCRRWALSPSELSGLSE